MLLSTSLKLAAFAASLVAAAPSVSAELRQGPTGVEYAKRFTPSQGPNGLCIITCPLEYTVKEPGNKDDGVVLTSGPDGNPAGDRTACLYTNSSEESTSKAVAYCYYSNDGKLQTIDTLVFTDNGEGTDGLKYSPVTNCAPTAVRAASCNPPVRRTLSPLEKVIKSRQYNPRRRAIKQQ